MQPVTEYEFYTEKYGGTLPKADFERLRGRAMSYLVSVTLGKVQYVQDPLRRQVDMAVCALVDVIHKQESGGDVTSESNDGISVTYASKVQQTEQKQLYEAASAYLAWTGLMNRRCQ